MTAVSLEASNAFDLTAPIPRGTSVLEASAGTGKTFAIAHLAMRLVAEEGLSIESLLVVTFTNAAAAELRERIRARLQRGIDALRAVADGAPASVDEALRGVDAPLRAFARERLVAGRCEEAALRLELALASFDANRIGTIHGYCQRLLARHAFECGVEFDFELAEDLAGMLRSTAYDFVARRVAEGDPAFVERTSEGLSLARLPSIAAVATREPHAKVFPERPTPPPRPPRSAVEEAHRAMITSWCTHVDAVRTALRTALDAGVLNGTYALTKPGRFASAFASLDRLVRGLGPGEVAVEDKVFEALRTVRTSKLVKSGKGRDRFVDLLASPFFEVFDDYVRVAESHAAFLDAHELGVLHDYVAFAREDVATQKTQQRVRGFDDLLRLVDDALAGPSGARLAERIRTDAEVALIDEFQDTDPVQWSLFERVFHGRGGRLLLIGDPKQAIYGFRGADLETYLRARRAADQVRTLDVNHRSDGVLLAAIEALYRTNPDPFGLADASEDARVAFVPVKAAREGARIAWGGRAKAPIRLYGAVSSSAPDTEEDAAAADVGPDEDDDERSFHPTALAVARELSAGVGLHRPGGAVSPLRPSDCAVLARGRRALAAIQRDLRRLGIPSVMHTDESVFRSDEARELELVLAASIAPRDRRALASALATTIVGASLSDVARLETEESALEEVHDRFRSFGDALRNEGVAAFFRRFVDDRDVVRRMLALPGGERRVANLLQLGELLQLEAEREHLGPEALIARLSRLRHDEAAAGDDRRVRLESDAEAVELCTIHASKGLEWGVVFCDSLGNAPGDPKDPAIVLRDAAGTPTLHLLGGPWGEAVDAARLRHRVDARTEELRLAYVALTRARHALFIRMPTRPSGTPFEQLFFLGTGRDLWLRTSAKGSAPEGRVEVSDRASACARIAEALEGHVVYDEIPERVRGVARASGGAAPPSYAVRGFERRRGLDLEWRITSYTGLSAERGATHERRRVGEEDADGAAAGDASLQASASVPSVPAEVAELLGVWDSFRGGRELGVDVHAALETTTSFEADALAEVLRRRFERRAPRSTAPAVDDAVRTFDAATESASLARALSAALATPLFDGSSFRLGALAPDAMLREAAFALPVGGGTEARDPERALSASALARVFASHGRPTLPAEYATRVAALALSPALRGFLVGSIDVVFEYEGRIYVADYKTTRLGPDPDAYARDRLPQAMMDHDYSLQALIYALAVHRHLARREPGYDYDVRFGGVLHLFVRAMHERLGPGYGIFVDRPPRAQIEEFERALGLHEEAP